MSDQKFITINDEFLIKKSISKNILKKYLSFVANQRCIKISKVKEGYDKNIPQIIKLPKNIKQKNVDLVIKSKFSHINKFVDLKRSLIFYEYRNTGLKLSKIKKFKLADINFFPKTYVSKGIIFQKLARGIYFRPENLTELNQNLLMNIANTIYTLSSKNNGKIKISDYLDKIKFSNKKDTLNNKIMNIFCLTIKKYKNEIVRTTLSHGDLKFEHLFLTNNKVEYLIDWENVDTRIIFFDLMNLFIPWFVHRSFNYIKIKKYINRFVEKYLPNLVDSFKNQYDLYFSIFAIERYIRINNKKNLKFNKKKAYQRYNLLFENLAYELKYK